MLVSTGKTRKLEQCALWLAGDFLSLFTAKGSDFEFISAQAVSAPGAPHSCPHQERHTLQSLVLESEVCGVCPPPPAHLQLITEWQNSQCEGRKVVCQA